MDRTRVIHKIIQKPASVFTDSLVVLLMGTASDYNTTVPSPFLVLLFGYGTHLLLHQLFSLLHVTQAFGTIVKCHLTQWSLAIVWRLPPMALLHLIKSHLYF